ncbi:MAG: response regulator [Geminicoccaceae bacterium]
MGTDRDYKSGSQDVAILTAELAELRRLLDEAERASEAKSMFFATMSHEIREPMNGVLGMTRLLLETPLSEEQKGYADAVHFSGQALLTIINDILDLSRMEAGQLKLDQIDFDLGTVAERTIEILKPHAEDKGLALELVLETTLPKTLSGDPGRLRQLLMNLLGNAIKFTETGMVRLELASSPHAADEVRLGLRVSDTGIGIPDHLRDRLFTPYAQADPSVPRLYGGSGLGLTICKRLVGLMNGSIRVTSEEGRGTVFDIELVFDRATSDRTSAPPSGQINGLRLLVVDPNDVTRAALDQQALSWGAVTQLVATGSEALVSLQRAAASGALIDVVLIDGILPDMSGEDLGRKVRADDRLGQTQLVMMTSSGLRGDAARVAGIGFAAYLPKPVTAIDLLNCLLQLRDTATRRSRDLITVHSLSETKPASLDILLADDNPVNCKLATIMLEKAGHRTDVVLDGADAIEAVAKKRYDLILMDVQMPGVDGLSATRQIRENAAREGIHIPIIAVTANAMKGDDQRCFAAGMDDYVTKPVDRARLLAKVNQWGYRHSVA